jgi:hypothetical protein
MSKTDPFKKDMPALSSADKEKASLLATVSTLGNDLNKVQEIQNYKGPSTEPNESLLRDLWDKVYLSIIQQIYSKGLSYWNSKPRNLEMELELAVIRADESIEAYIRTRNVTPDPVAVAQSRWAREQLAKRTY